MRFKKPGVFSKEVAPDTEESRPISPSNWGIVGQFNRGPVGDAVIVQGDGEVEQIFGSFEGDSMSRLLLRKAFDNGLQTAFVVREAGDGAERADGALVEEVRDVTVEDVNADVSGTTVTVDTELADDWIAPESVRVFFLDQEDIVDEDQGLSTVSGIGTYEFTLKNEVESSSATIEYLDSGGATLETFTDGGSGTLSGDNGGTGTIDYETGEISVTLGVSSVDGGTFEAEYTVDPIQLVRGETFSESVAGAEIYHGSLDNKYVKLDTVEFTWEDTDGNTRTATSDASGNITGDAVGTVTRMGEVKIDVGDDTVDSTSELSVDYNYDEFFEATDDGSGSLTNESPFGALSTPGTINYETGEIDFETKTLVDQAADGVEILVDYDNETHRSQSRNPGSGTNEYNLAVVPNVNYFDDETGQYEKFNLFLEEIDEDGTQVIDQFFKVNLDDVTDSDHISKRLNDTQAGSDLVEIIEPIAESIPTNLRGTKVDPGDEVHVGEGTNREFVAKLDLHDAEIVAGTLKITYEGTDGETHTIEDDANGGLTGDVDAGSVDYDTGRLVVTPSVAVKTGSSVVASYITLPPGDEANLDYTGGADGAGVTRDDVSHPDLEDDRRGVYALKDFQEEQAMISAPGFAADPVVASDLEAYAQQRKNAVVVATHPEGYNSAARKRWVNRKVAKDTDRLSFYGPWLDVRDPSTGNTITVPPVGHVAGRIARTDQDVGADQAPAGLDYGNITSYIDTAQDVTESDLEDDEQAQLNMIHEPHNRAPKVIFGAFTQYPEEDAVEDGKYAFINQRRIVDQARTIITFNLFDLLFRDANLNTVNRAGQIAEGVLSTFFENNALKGSTEEEAFTVIADSRNNPPEDLENGLITVDWGVAVETPARFVFQRIQRKIN